MLLAKTLEPWKSQHKTKRCRDFRLPEMAAMSNESFLYAYRLCIILYKLHLLWNKFDFVGSGNFGLHKIQICRSQKGNGGWRTFVSFHWRSCLKFAYWKWTKWKRSSQSVDACTRQPTLQATICGPILVGINFQAASKKTSSDYFY